MKQRAKKFFLGVIIPLIVMMLFSGCSKKQTESMAASTAAQVTGTLPVTPNYGDEKYFPLPAKGWIANPKYPQQPPISGYNEFPITPEKTNLRVALVQSTSVTDYENNDLTKYMEALTNVHVVWELLPNINPMEKINLMFSAGEALPDVFLKASLPNTMLITLGSAGLIVPLQDLIEQHGYNTKMLFEEKMPALPAITAADGNIYSLCSWSSHEPNQLSMRFFINTYFLEKLGMKEPTTTDELYEYLKAVKTRDPNGNGKADEIPLITSTNGWNAQIDGFLMNAFIINETSTSTDPAQRRRVFLTHDGKIDVAFNKPEWREGLAYMHKLYAEGLLAPESFTLKAADIVALVENEGVPIVGSTTNGSPHVFATVDGERRKIYKAIAPIKGPNGVQLAWYNEYMGPETGDFVITKDCKIPEVAMKWADYQYTPDFTMRNRYGILDRDWLIPHEGTLAVDGQPALYEEILKFGAPTSAYWANGLRWGRWGAYKRPLSETDPFELEKVLYDAYLLYLPYAYRKSVPFTLQYTADEARRYSELNRTIIEYVEQSLAGFVTGRLNLDQNWNRYLADLDRMGLAELIELTQTSFDRSWKKVLGY
jgi:putative aldouronate transport system substrate-binding protein